MVEGNDRDRQISVEEEQPGSGFGTLSIPAELVVS